MTSYKAPHGKRNRKRKFIMTEYAKGQRRCYCGVQLVFQPGQPNSATFEHLVPKAAGGTYHQKNGLMVCHRCNNERSNMCWLKWLDKHNPPKKEWLKRKYLDAVAHYNSTGRKIRIPNKQEVNIYIQNLIVHNH